MKKPIALIGGLLLLAATASVLFFLSGFRPQITPIPVANIEAAARQTGMGDCFWAVVISKGGLNYAYPDTNAQYWMTQLNLPEGAKLEMHGEFPHSRYLSFNVYDDDGQPVDRINDVNLTPDAGAVNPFIAGQRRDSAQRGYKLNLVHGDFEAGTPMSEIDAKRPANTIFTPKGGKPVQLALRIYVPDQGLNIKGGAPLPTPVMTMADGSTVRGEELCRRIVIKDGAARNPHMALEPTKTLLNLESTTSPYHPAQKAPKWDAFFNTRYFVSSTLIGTHWEWLRALLSTKRKGGFYSTLDNTYMSMYVDNRFGDLLVLQGKAPTTPHTLKGDPVMETAQLRYWSLCKYRSVNNTQTDHCVFDQEVPVDAEGNYTLVVSTAAQRPANAQDGCGVAWLDWGDGDGIANPHGGLLVYRHMSPSPDFTHSLFSTRAPGEEEQALGEYYPKTQYMQREEFEKLGCRKPG
jgi:hypothetical protein